MINFIINEFRNLDKKVHNIMKKGLLFSFSVCWVSMIMLLVYHFFIISPLLFNCALLVFQASLVYSCMFFISGIAFNKLITL